MLRVKFAYRADAGTTLYFGIKDAFGNVIGKKELTFVARKAIINAVTIDLKTYDFVKVFFSDDKWRGRRRVDRSNFTQLRV